MEKNGNSEKVRETECKSGARSQGSSLSSSQESLSESGHRLRQAQPAGKQYPQRTWDRIKSKRQHGAKKQWRPAAIGQAVKDLDAQAAALRDVAEDIAKDARETAVSNGSAGPTNSAGKSEPSPNQLTEEYDVDQAAVIRNQIEGSSFSFKEAAGHEFDSVYWFLVGMTVIDLFLGVGSLGLASVVKLLLLKKVGKILTTFILGAVMKWGKMGREASIALTFCVTLGTIVLGILDEVAVETAILLTTYTAGYWVGMVWLAATQVRVSPFQYRAKHSYKIKRVSEKDENPYSRADAQSLTDCKHKIPLYAEVKYEYLISLVLCGFKFKYRREGKPVTMKPSLEQVMQLMVPRTTGLELSDEQIGNALSNMNKSLHSVAISKLNATVNGTFEHSKALAYALVKRVHQKMARVPFPRPPVPNAQ